MACRTQPADDNDEHRPLGSEDAASTLTPDAAAKVRERDDLPAGQQPPPRLRRPEDGEARSRRHPPLRCCSAGRSNDRLFVIKLTRAPATPCPVPFFSSHLSSPFPSASVAPGSFRCCRPPPCRFPLLRAFLPASVPHPGDKLPLNSLPYREIKNGVLWGFRGKNAKEWCLRWDAEEWS
ncbi:hypothetical protein PVAP13_4NG305338 [Panicum virgatum]|uniref:Uncharacterized protein n=1 Tax=Panicum virgatum TaxID=38727 RepID=A0A8T0T9V5_PANVG|nr:hypothetical protein PVAP13_4NG305338 [Panicum virgatum]